MLAMSEPTHEAAMRTAEAHKDVVITHTHLNDDTVAGIRIEGKPCFSVQYHPEASPGPHDSSYLFDQFISQINNHKKQAS
ncbi:MAG: glutamine amidotransferase-related protein [Flavobacteriaceae bacterium]